MAGRADSEIAEGSSSSERARCYSITGEHWRSEFGNIPNRLDYSEGFWAAACRGPRPSKLFCRTQLSSRSPCGERENARRTNKCSISLKLII